MKLNQQEKFTALLRIHKHEFHSIVKDHVEHRKETETNASTLSNLLSWYSKFRDFLYQYNQRTILLSTQGIGKDYLAWLETKGFANSHLKGSFKTLLATINRIGLYHHIQIKELFRGYAKESRANEDYFLTNDEVKELLALKIEDNLLERERVALDAFIVSCFTGCRKSEIPTVVAIDDKTLQYTSIKTKKDVRVPYNDVVRPYIESGHYKKPIKNIKNQNEILHAILKNLNWNDPVKKYRLMGKKKEIYTVPRYAAITYHSGRKFFGKMLLDMNVSMYKVSQLLGHESIDTTQKYYAALSREKMMEETNEVINNF